MGWEFVYAVEVDEYMVRELEEMLIEQSLTNVVAVLGDSKLPDEEIDLAMTCLTSHPISDRVAYFARLQSDLAPGGRVVHLDEGPAR